MLSFTKGTIGYILPAKQKDKLSQHVVIASVRQLLSGTSLLAPLHAFTPTPALNSRQRAAAAHRHRGYRVAAARPLPHTGGGNQEAAAR